MKKQKIILVVLLVSLGGALLNAVVNSPQQDRVLSQENRISQPKMSGKQDTVESGIGEYEVRMDLLTRGEEKFPGFRRNLFGPVFAVKPPAPPPPPLPPLEKPEFKQLAPPPAPPPPPALPSDLTRRELANFTFLGFLEQGDQKTVFLSAADEIFLVKEGDRFGKKKEFFVHRLTPKELVIHRKDEPRPIHIALVEQETLIPVMKSPAVRRDTSSPPPPVVEFDKSTQEDKSLHHDQNAMPKS